MFRIDKARSNSSTSVSSASSSSSSSSRAEDVFSRLVSLAPNASFHLWSAGNVRIAGRDLPLSAADAVSLMATLGSDTRFEVVDLVYLDAEGDEWKATYALQ